MNQQDIIAIKYNGMLKPIPHPPPPQMFSKAFQFTMRYGHTHWRDLWLVVLGTPPAPLLPFHFWSRSRFTCSKTITCGRIPSGKKKRIKMLQFSSIKNLSYMKYIFIVYLNKHTIIKENGDQVIKSMLTVHSVSFFLFWWKFVRL